MTTNAAASSRTDVAAAPPPTPASPAAASPAPDAFMFAGEGPTFRTPPGFDRAVGQSDAATTAEIDGQLVALDMVTGTCFGLNRIATRIWQLIEQPATARAIARALLAEYDVDWQTCADQVTALLDELVEIGLAVPAPAH